MDGGRKFVSHSTRIDKRYFDKTAQEWRETAFLNKQDLATLHVMLPQVHDWIREDIEQARSNDYDNRNDTETPREVEPF